MNCSLVEVTLDDHIPCRVLLPQTVTNMYFLSTTSFFSALTLFYIESGVDSAQLTFNQEHVVVDFDPIGPSYDAIQAYSDDDLSILLKHVISKFGRISSPQIQQSKFDLNSSYHRIPSVVAKLNEDRVRNNLRPVEVIVPLSIFTWSDAKDHCEVALQAAEYANAIFPGTVPTIQVIYSYAPWATTACHDLISKSPLKFAFTMFLDDCDSNKLEEKLTPFLSLPGITVSVQGQMWRKEGPCSELVSFRKRLQTCQDRIHYVAPNLEPAYHAWFAGTPPDAELGLFWKVMNDFGTESNSTLILDQAMDSYFSVWGELGWWRLVEVEDWYNVSTYGFVEKIEHLDEELLNVDTVCHESSHKQHK